jgi:toxin-antitoxin system PIN domain toxin
MALAPVLLDINVLTALLWPAHEHHEAAHRWFGALGRTPWATCPITQLGFMRLVSNPAFSRDALTPAAAAALLADNLAHHAHQFWPDHLPAPAAVKERVPQGYRQFTDAYLIALAARRKGVFATFDRGAARLGANAKWVEVVAT